MCELTVKEDTRAVAPVSEKTISDYLAAFGLASQLTKQEISQFVEIAKAFNLNPFKREVYCLPYGHGDSRRLSIIVGYEVYLKRADQNPAFDGYTTEFGTENGSLTCTCTVYRKDRKIPTSQTVSMKEYNTGKSLWVTKPRTMLEKVAIATAFRRAFPNDFGGMPYTKEELSEEMTEPRDVTPMPQVEPAPAPQMEAPAPEPQPEQKAKATPEQTEKLKALAKNFTPEELAALKADYGHDISMLIDKMTEYSTPAQEQAQEKPQPHKWATQKMMEALQKAKSGQQEQFEDDEKELYK